MNNINPIFAIDGYKLSHRAQFPKGTELVFGNFTPRSNKYFKTPVFENPKLMWAGAQSFVLSWLVANFDQNFFQRPRNTVVREFKTLVDSYLGKGAVPVQWISDLHEVGYLPVEIKSLPEGTLVEMKVPVLTIKNTDKRFFWLPNFLETLLSAELWPVATAATIAFNYRIISEKFALETCDDNSHVTWQCHDFAARGNMGMDANSLTGMGHLFSFRGTDSVYALARLRRDYAEVGDPDYLYAGSVPATEHSVMCMGEQQSEMDTFHRLLTEIHPNGIVSVVSDTWDYWNVLTNILPQLKDQIMARDGKLVIRPDSGDPTDIICGFKVAARFKDENVFNSWVSGGECDIPDESGWVIQIGDKYFTYSSFNGVYFCTAEKTEAEVKGSIQVLYDLFGGTLNSKGFKVLDSHIGLIYGDSITLERANTILTRLKEKGFASSAVVFGIGSFTYQYVTRDSFGFAMKATYGVVNGVGRAIFKDPKTDDGLKRSLKGLIMHRLVEGEWSVKDEATPIEEETSDLPIIYTNGHVPSRSSIAAIRSRVDAEVEKVLAEMVKS